MADAKSSIFAESNTNGDSMLRSACIRILEVELHTEFLTKRFDVKCAEINYRVVVHCVLLDASRCYLFHSIILFSR